MLKKQLEDFQAESEDLKRDVDLSKKEKQLLMEQLETERNTAQSYIDENDVLRRMNENFGVEIETLREELTSRDTQIATLKFECNREVENCKRKVIEANNRVEENAAMWAAGVERLRQLESNKGQLEGQVASLKRALEEQEKMSQAKATEEKVKVLEQQLQSITVLFEKEKKSQVDNQGQWQKKFDNSQLSLNEETRKNKELRKEIEELKGAKAAKESLELEVEEWKAKAASNESRRLIPTIPTIPRIIPPPNRNNSYAIQAQVNSMAAKDTESERSSSEESSEEESSSSLTTPSTPPVTKKFSIPIPAPSGPPPALPKVPKPIIQPRPVDVNPVQSRIKPVGRKPASRPGLITAPTSSLTTASPGTTPEKKNTFEVKLKTTGLLNNLQ